MSRSVTKSLTGEEMGHYGSGCPFFCNIIRIEVFLVLAAAACAGTWLSFLLRRVTLSFADLENVDEDRLNPVIRVLFVVGLTCIIGAFIATDFIQSNIAGVKSLKTELLHRGLVAAAMGVICGISERALASVVSRRSDDVKQPSRSEPLQP